MCLGVSTLRSFVCNSVRYPFILHHKGSLIIKLSYCLFYAFYLTEFKTGIEIDCKLCVKLNLNVYIILFILWIWIIKYPWWYILLKILDLGEHVGSWFWTILIFLVFKQETYAVASVWDCEYFNKKSPSQLRIDSCIENCTTT